MSFSAKKASTARGTISTPLTEWPRSRSQSMSLLLPHSGTSAGAFAADARRYKGPPPTTPKNPKTTSNKPARRRGATLAKRADRHVLYQHAVQAPDYEIEFFEDHYKELRGKKPRSLLEDFCGTALLCVE